MIRPSLHLVFLKVADIISQRSTCLRQRIGCVITKEGRIISCGYNGVASGVEHCSDTNKCLKDLKKDEDYKICFHAEQNAICQCAKNGISTNDSTLYCTKAPCLTCSKLIVASGIKSVYIVDNGKSDTTGVEYLKSMGVLVRLSFVNERGTINV